MRATGGLIRGAWLLAVFAGLLACAPAPVPLDEPSSRALEIFDLARGGDPDDARVAKLFDIESNGMGRARLHDALSELALVDELAIVDTETLEGLDRRVIDLTGNLPGEGQADYSVSQRRKLLDYVKGKEEARYQDLIKRLGIRR